jgi:hypothetical protein
VVEADLAGKNATFITPKDAALLAAEADNVITI